MSRKPINILFTTFLILSFLLIYLFYVREDMSDFGVCYKGGKRIIEGETLYRVADGHMQYKYSPGSAVFFSFFSFFPYEVAKFIWYLLELSLLFFILVLSHDLLPLKQKKKGPVILLSFLVLLKFLAREIELGQANILIAFLFMMVLLTMIKENDIGGGFFWGFSLLFKPYALVFLPYFILKKKFKLIASGLGIAILGLFSPVIFYGFKGNIAVLAEWQQTLSQSTVALLDSYDNASLHAFFLKIISADSRELAWIFIAVTIFFLGCSFLWMIYVGKRERLNRPEVLEFAFLFILIPLLSPLGWYYNYLYSLLAVIFLLNSIGRFPPILRYVLIVNLVIIGASLREIMGKEVFRFYTQYSLVVLNHLIVLFYLFYSRIKKYS